MCTNTLPPSCLGPFAYELLLPGESLQTFPLAEVTPLSTSIPLSTFNIQRPVGLQGPLPVNLTHHILTKDLALNATSASTMRSPVLLQSSSLFVGDPIALKHTVLDFAGLASAPDTSGKLVVPIARNDIPTTENVTTLRLHLLYCPWTGTGNVLPK